MLEDIKDWILAVAVSLSLIIFIAGGFWWILIRESGENPTVLYDPIITVDTLTGDIRIETPVIIMRCDTIWNNDPGPFWPHTGEMETVDAITTKKCWCGAYHEHPDCPRGSRAHCSFIIATNPGMPCWYCYKLPVDRIICHPETLYVKTTH